MLRRVRTLLSRSSDASLRRLMLMSGAIACRVSQAGYHTSGAANARGLPPGILAQMGLRVTGELFSPPPDQEATE